MNRGGISLRLRCAGFGLAAATGCVGLGWLAGCGTGLGGEAVVQPPAVPTEDPGQDVEAERPAYLVFEEASRLYISEGSTLSVPSTISTPGQVRVYDLGERRAGDELTLRVNTADSGLDPALAVFEDGEDVVLINDDLGYYEGIFDSYARLLCPRALPSCYVAVSSSGRSDTSGDFTLEITLQRGLAVEPVEPQIVYLEFRGGAQVIIGRRPAVDIPPFAGDMIGSTFAADTDELVSRIVSQVRSSFVGVDVTLLASTELDPPDTPHSTVYFGTYDPGLLGISDSIDLFNAHKIQESIVFVDTFAAFLTLEPDVEEMANALANVTSHEIGHLLGLHHTSDYQDIMDTSASLRQMLATQEFRRAPLAADAFATGYQDPLQRMLDAVGGAEIQVAARKMVPQAPRDPWYDQGSRVPARGALSFGTACTCGH